MSKRDWMVEYRENLLHGILQFWIGDHEQGDWYAAIDPDGRIDGTKAGPWRGPYHAARACLEIIRRLGARSERIPLEWASHHSPCAQ